MAGMDLGTGIGDLALDALLVWYVRSVQVSIIDFKSTYLLQDGWVLPKYSNVHSYG